MWPLSLKHIHRSRECTYGRFTCVKEKGHCCPLRAAGPTPPSAAGERQAKRGPRSPSQLARERGAGPGGAASAQAQCGLPRAAATAAAAAARAAPQARDRQGREEPETEEEAEAAAEPLEVLPGGVRGVSPRRRPPPSSASHLPPPSRRPPPSARDARAPPGAQSCGRTRRRRRRQRQRLPRGGCDSLTGAIDGRRRGFSSWNLPQARSSGRNKKESERSESGRAGKGSSPQLLSARRLGELGALPADPSPPPLPTAPQPSGRALAIPRRIVRRRLEGSVGLSMEAGTFFDSVEERGLFSKSD
ncbi:PREDICTED: uncharacterized protein LOC101380836 [Odobenus rosmarus divergens]|uniref:Uncharacterized protein LOC101380836 n=1 Tax=Odobenus rosmarus divergens TaxID=9708 RepID=A0A9B0G694_ODORO